MCEQRPAFQKPLRLLKNEVDGRSFGAPECFRRACLYFHLATHLCVFPFAFFRLFQPDSSGGAELRRRAPLGEELD